MLDVIKHITHDNFFF